MKTIAVVIFLCIHLTSPAQNDSLVRYWDGSVETTLPHKAKTRAVYYFKNGLWQMESRYLANGSLYMKGAYRDREALKKEGKFTRYYDNGKQMGTVAYRNNEKEGLEKTWHKNGNLEDSIFYKQGFVAGRGRSWNDKGHVTEWYDLDDQGNGIGRFFYGKDSLLSEGCYEGGKKTGTWEYFAREGYKDWVVTYVEDSVITANCFDSTGTAGASCIWQQAAEPNGGLEGWKNYLTQVLNHPEYPSRKLIKSGVPYSGKVWVRFLVEKDGSLSDIQIIRSLNNEADQIVMEAMKNAPRWTPGIYKNKFVRSYHTQPLTFDITIE